MSTISVHEVLRVGGMVVPTPHPEASVHFSLVENIWINLMNIPISQKMQQKISWELNRGE